MATIMDYHTLDKLMAPHDRRYSWPDSTCLHPALDMLEYIRLETIELEPILKMSEEAANEIVVYDYGASWFSFILEKIVERGYGYEIGLDGLQCGDLVEVTSDRIKPVGCANKKITNFIALVANSETLFLRGWCGVTPLPVECVKVLRALRFNGVLV